ncbi:MAG: hydroxymethylglutaryl-CoA reductase, partial [Cardiobacterium sp.]
MTRNDTHSTPIPTRWIGPLTICGNAMNDTVRVPLATYESPLWPSTARGAKVAEHCGGVRCTIVDERMARSVLLTAADAATAFAALQSIRARRDELAAVIAATSRFARLLDLHAEIVGNLLYLRLECSSGDASGHNMITKAADAAISWLLAEYPQLAYGSISANYCTDKKASAVNGILGRGKNVIAELTIPRRICERFLRTTPEQIVALNLRKNFIGGILAGSIRSANAHFANILLAFYLATGQDAAN